MLPLNVDIPEPVFARLRLAKAVTNIPIRKIVLVALDAWLKEQGITDEKLRRLAK